MTTPLKKDLIILKEDYDLLMNYAKTKKDLLNVEKINSSWFLESLENARVLHREEFPRDVIRLNSKVILRDKVARYNYTYTVVLPEEADHRTGKVSVLAPIGASMFGFRQGEDVCWQSAIGKRMFIVMNVIQLYG
jgi:regulator of nucleoside diphosphate kinase